MAGTRPRLVLVTGPAGSGKTTLAHELARAVGCPAVCRDEIKEGLAHTAGRDPTAEPVTNLAATQAFVVVLRTLLEQGVSVVAEAAFLHELWGFVLGQLDAVAEVVVIRCRADDAVLRDRLAARPPRPAHDDEALLANVDDYLRSFDPIHVDAPTIDVDTSSDRTPSIEEIATFVSDGAIDSPTQ